MVYLILSTIVTFFSLVITRDRDIFSNCLAKIEALFIAFSAFMFISARAVDRFFTILSASVKSLF
jgi:hypothetical protein